MKPKTSKVSPTSPTPPKKVFDFYEALRRVQLGQKVARLVWPTGEWMLMLAGFLCIHRDGGDHRLQVSDGDLTGQDWVAV